MIDERPYTDMFESRFEPTHSAASVLRRQVLEYLDSKAVEAHLVPDIELVVSELLSNAVEQQPTKPISLVLVVDRFSLHLTVTNHRPSGELDEPSVAQLPVDADHHGALPDRGRGLAIVQALADGMWIHGGRDSFSVSCLHKRPG